MIVFIFLKSLLLTNIFSSRSIHLIDEQESKLIKCFKRIRDGVSLINIK